MKASELKSGLEAFGNELKFLHQLQNLYFALTGTELTCKTIHNDPKKM